MKAEYTQEASTKVTDAGGLVSVGIPKLQKWGEVNGFEIYFRGKTKRACHELDEEVKEMENTRIIYIFLAWEAGRMTGGISYWNKENQVGGGGDRQWSGEGPRVPLLPC